MKHLLNRRLVTNLVGVLIVTVLVHTLLSSTYGDKLGHRTMQLSDNNVNATSNYSLAFDYISSGSLGSIQVQFCSNDPYPGKPCTPPVGFDATAAVLAQQSGETGFTISNASTVNQIILTRAISPVAVGGARYEFTGIKNPSVTGPYYVRVQTYATNNISGPASDYGGIAFWIDNSFAVSATVPPFLLFCTGVTINNQDCANAQGDFINFGELSSTKASKGTSQMLVSTNAELGYIVTVSGTTLTSGNDVIKALSSNDISRPGTAQFGFNLTANSSPSGGQPPYGPGNTLPLNNYFQPNSYRFVSGENLITHSTTDDVRVFTASYIANVPKDQASGIYVSTLTYVCFANF